MPFTAVMRSVLWPIARSQPVPPAVYVELVGLLFTVRLPIAILGLSFGFLGVMIGWRSGDSTLIATAALGVTFSIVRLVVHAAYRRDTVHKPLSRSDARTWERRYAAGGLATAALVGAFGARTFMLPDVTMHMLVVALIFGYGAGAVTRCSIRPALTLLILYLAVVPPVIASALTFDPAHIGLALLFLAFMFGAFETVAHLYTTTLGQLTLKRQFAELARQDPLTGLPNRLMLKEDVEAALAKCRRSHSFVAIHSIDLDHFKEANDRFGHPVGDALLKAVARRLTRLLRSGDLIARLGGDEFILVQVGIVRREEADIFARRVVKALNTPFVIEGRKLHIGGSVGAALTPHDGETLDDLLVKADEALYAAKRSRNSFSFVNPEPVQDGTVANGAMAS